MNHKQYIAIALILSAFGSTVFPLGMSSAYAEGETAKPADTVSAEVAKPLQAAQELYKQKKYAEALAALNEASALKKTPYEAYVIDRTRAAIATASGDDKLKLESYQAVVASGRLAADEQLKFVQAISHLYYEKADYAQAIAWTERFLKEGGVDPQAHELLVQSYYLSNDLPRAAKELQIDLDAAEKAGTPPTDKQLHILISIATKQNDNAGYVRALEKFVTYYPKKEYWADLLYRLQTRPDFSSRLTLDVYRLKFSLGLLSKPAEYVDMAELAILAGFPAEAKKVMEAGYKSGVLGAGADAEKQKSVLNSATRKAADDLKTIAQTEADVRKNKDGSGLANLGYAYVTMNQFDKGLALMEQGVKAPGSKRAEEAKLHLATAYALAGRTQEAIAAFKTVQGSDGSADLAHYWVLQLTHPMP
ncbi:MAG: tetratricopeptide repeat protein [Burkholderiaceae bacterium]|nr:tetratricopeptide repeat protein [Burkholderiaceae bacterium]